MTNWPTQYQPWLTSLCTCLTGRFHDNFKVRLENALIYGSDKASSDHQSPYALQVVIVRKKTGEIQLCVDYWKLNSIVVRDAFPLPLIDEAPQAVHNLQWFTSFYLVQGYLQIPVEEADIKKTAFRAGLSGLYEFTHMPFGLSNSGSSFCHLMEYV